MPIAPNASTGSCQGAPVARAVGGGASVMLPAMAASFIDIMSQLPWAAPQSTCTGPLVGAATVNGARGCLSSAFTYFFKRQWINRNPVQGVEKIERPDGIY